MPKSVLLSFAPLISVFCFALWGTLWQYRACYGSCKTIRHAPMVSHTNQAHHAPSEMDAMLAIEHPYPMCIPRQSLDLLWRCQPMIIRSIIWLAVSSKTDNHKGHSL